MRVKDIKKENIIEEQAMPPDEDQADLAKKTKDSSAVSAVGRGESTAVQIAPQQEAKQTIHQWVDTINKLFQIAALIAAGAWAWIGFQQTIAPGLEPKLGISSEIHWATLQPASQHKAKQEPDSCQASLQIKVNNPGKRPFEVTKAIVTAWLVPLDDKDLGPNLAQRKVLNVDWTRDHFPVVYNSDQTYFQLKDGQQVNVTDEEFVSRDLKDHYSEGVENTAAYEFFFKYEPRMIVAFYVQVEGERPSSYWPFFSHPVPIANYTYQVDQLCGGDWDKHTKPSAEAKAAAPAKSPSHP
jgi:hypothetical protein